MPGTAGRVRAGTHLSRMPASYPMIAQTMYGLEEVLAGELAALGATGIERHNRAVAFSGDKACMYRANLCLRTALRVLVPIHSFTLRNEHELYDGIRAMRWEEHLAVDGTLAIGCTLRSDRFNHSQFLALKAKDAIADRFRDRTGKRPSVDLDFPDLRIHLHVHEDRRSERMETRCTVSLDSSGSSLHKRGYRDQTNLAPISEVLAAGLVLLTGWDRTANFVDPMCGSGTILAEAAMIAANLPAGYHRDGFGFERWKDFDKGLWQGVFDQAMSKVEEDRRPLILGGEISSNVARKAAVNIASAGLKDRVRIKNTAFADLEAPEGGGVLVLNPPYGERMEKDDDINALYKSIGDTLKKKWAGYSAWVITSNMEAAKYIHLTPKPKIKLFNGALECRFMRYELYSGTRRKMVDGGPAEPDRDAGSSPE